MGTFNTIPADDSSFLTRLTNFLSWEMANYNYRRYAGAVLCGGWHADPGAGLTATIPATVAFPHGYYTKEDAAAHTYTASTDTYVYIRWDNTTPIVISGATITYGGTSSYYVFAEKSNGSVEPVTPQGALILMKVITDATDITSVTDLRSGEVPVEGIMEESGAAFSTILSSVAYVGNRTIVINKHHRLSANTSVPASTTLKVVNGAKVRPGTYTFTVSGPVIAGDYVWLDFESTGNLVWSNGQSLRASWFAPADGTDQSTALKEMIAAAPLSACEFVIPYSSLGFGIGAPLVIPDAGGTLRLNWRFRGEGGKGKFVTTAAVSVFESYDVVNASPAHTNYDIIFESLELDGNAAGVNGIHCHGVSSLTIQNCDIHEFSGLPVALTNVTSLLIIGPYFWGNGADPITSTVEVRKDVDSYWKLYSTEGYPIAAQSASTDVIGEQFVSTSGTLDAYSRRKLLTNGSYSLGGGSATQDIFSDIRATLTTVDDTPVALWSITLADKTAYVIEATVLAQQEDGADRAAFQMKALVYRTAAGDATIQGTVTTIAAAIADTGAAWDATFTGTAHVVDLTVTGDAANDVHWLANLRYMQILETV